MKLLRSLRTSARQRGIPVSPPAGSTTSPFFARIPSIENKCESHLSYLFSTDLEKHSSAARTVELTEKNTLPGAKIDFAVFNQDLFAAANQRAFTMRIGIAFGMSIAGTAMRYQFFKGQEYIVRNRRVGIFVYGYRCCRVRTINNAIAICNTGLTNSSINLACNINHLVAVLTAYVKIFFDDSHYCTSTYGISYICSTTSIPSSSLKPCLIVFAVKSQSNSLVGLLFGSACKTGQFV